MVMNHEITKYFPQSSAEPDEVGEMPPVPEVIEVNCTHQINFKDAINIKHQPHNSVDLVITSPPYWSIKDYGKQEQLGFHDSLNGYMTKLVNILSFCADTLKHNSKLCINIGDQFLRASQRPKRVYQIIPLHAMIINRMLTVRDDLVYLGSIDWVKVTTSHTSGGGQIMGSYPFPKSGYFFVNREFIAIFCKNNKQHKDSRPRPDYKEASRMSLEEWREYFKDTWRINAAQQDSHIAIFPDEIPSRLIKMYSFVGDIVLDPFLGSGTTSRAAGLLGRNSLGYEIGFETKNGTPWKELIHNKIEVGDIKVPLCNKQVLKVFNQYKYQ